MNMEKNMELLNKIPKIYHEAITSIYKDDDGYWAYIENGYVVRNYFSEHTIHEDTLTEFKRIFKYIEKEE
jgi:hypothetical protein